VTIPDWQSTALHLARDAEESLSIVDCALSDSDCEVRMRTIRNGRRAYKDIASRRLTSMLAPLESAALEELLKNIKEPLRLLRDGVG